LKTTPDSCDPSHRKLVEAPADACRLLVPTINENSASHRQCCSRTARLRPQGYLITKEALVSYSSSLCKGTVCHRRRSNGGWFPRSSGLSSFDWPVVVIEMILGIVTRLTRQPLLFIFVIHVMNSSTRNVLHNPDPQMATRHCFESKP
jgi:hypothetical protein